MTKQGKTDRKYFHNSPRRGFTLAMTLVVMLAGAALCGAAFHIYNSFSNTSMRQTDWTEEYAHLEEALEKGKKHVADMMNVAPPGEAIRGVYHYISPDIKIKDRLDLLLSRNPGELDERPSENSTIEPYDVTLHGRGDKAKIAVYVYDTSYEESDLAASTDIDITGLPPSSGIRSNANLIGGLSTGSRFEAQTPDGMETGGISGTSTGSALGSYIVRAVLTRSDGVTKSAEVAFLRGRRN